MTIALLTAFAVVVTANMWFLDRLLKRNTAQVERLLHWRHDPTAAALADAPTAELLYLPPEDDKAWNEHHKAGD